MRIFHFHEEYKIINHTFSLLYYFNTFIFYFLFFIKIKLINIPKNFIHLSHTLMGPNNNILKNDIPKILILIHQTNIRLISPTC